MHKHKYRRGKRFAGLFLSAALVMTGIPVQAAEFTAPSAEADLFSSGVADAYTGGSGTGTSSSVSSFYKGESSEPAADPTPTVTPADEPGETPSNTFCRAGRDSDSHTGSNTFRYAVRGTGGIPDSHTGDDTCCHTHSDTDRDAFDHTDSNYKSGRRDHASFYRRGRK